MADMNARDVMREIRAAFAEAAKPTDDVPELDVFLDGNLHLIGPESIRYYFPPIVERSIEAGDRNLLDDLLLVLRKVNQRHAAWQVSLFDKPQRDSVRMLLRFLKGNDEFLKSRESRVLVERAIPLWDKIA
jgi:hypothetical protein